MEPQTTERKKTLRVTVHARAGAPPIHPRTITLTNSVEKVVWRCLDLPSGATLQIVFRADPRGPFFLLESKGSEVIGWGNRGPEETSRRYTYVASIQTGTVAKPVGSGNLKNNATKPVPMIVDPPAGPRV
jgi:hypothetical protein